MCQFLTSKVVTGVSNPEQAVADAKRAFFKSEDNKVWEAYATYRKAKKALEELAMRTLTENERNKVVAMFNSKGYTQEVINEAMSNISRTCYSVYRATGKSLTAFLEASK